MKTSIASKSAVHPKTTPSEATQAPLSVELVVSGQDPQEFWAIVSAAPTRSWDEVRAALPADYRDMELKTRAQRPDCGVCRLGGIGEVRDESQ